MQFYPQAVPEVTERRIYTLDAIKGYVMCALMASAISGILKSISSEMRSFEKYIGFVASLAVVVMLAAPFVSIVGEIEKALEENSFSEEENGENSEENSTDETYDKTASAYYAKAVENSIESIILSKFSLKSEDFEVKANLEKDKNGNLSVKEIIIVLHSDIDTEEIKYYTEKILCLNTEIRRSEKQ